MDELQTEVTAPETATDDWGDFGAVIDQLEQQEALAVSTEPGTEQTATEETESAREDKSESVAALLNGAFSLAEQATSALSGVDFKFDQDGKQDVIKAAIPVLDKHGDGLLALFGDYIEEGALLFAVLGLIISARKTITQAKQVGGTDEQAKESTAETAQSG